MLRFLTIIVKRLFAKIEGFWHRKSQDDEWDEFLLGRYQENKRTYQWRDKQAEKEDKLAAKAKEYLRHQLPDEDIKTQIMKPISVEQRRQIRLRVSKQTTLSMVGLTVVVAALYLFWYQIAVIFLTMALGRDCGYRGALFEVRQTCRCGGKYFEIRNPFEKRGFCFGGCYDCECYQFQMNQAAPSEEAEASPVEIKVECPEKL